MTFDVLRCALEFPLPVVCGARLTRACAPGTAACTRLIRSCRLTATCPRFYLLGARHRGERFLRCSGSSRRLWHRPRACSPATARPPLADTQPQSLCRSDYLPREERYAPAPRRSALPSRHERNLTLRGRPMPTRNARSPDSDLRDPRRDGRRGRSRNLGQRRQSTTRSAVFSACGRTLLRALFGLWCARKRGSSCSESGMHTHTCP